MVHLNWGLKPVSISVRIFMHFVMLSLHLDAACLCVHGAGLIYNGFWLFLQAETLLGYLREPRQEASSSAL